MNEEPQEVLAAAFAHVRDMRSAGASDIPLRIAYAGGVIAGLEDTGALTSAEAGVWKGRLDELAQETNAWADEAIQSQWDSDRFGITAGFVRLIPGPFETVLYDGRFRVVVVELYEDRLYLYWHITPIPTLESILGQDLLAFNRDIEGLSPEAQERQRWTAVQTRLHTRELVLFDDLGTKFRATHGNAGGSQGEQWGVRVFVPAVPAGASALHLQFHNAHLNIPLK